jgi:hypothetical protein
MNEFNQMCSTCEEHRIMRQGKRQLKFYEAMAVPTLAHGTEIWTVTKKYEAKTETAEVKFFRSTADFIQEGHKKYKNFERRAQHFQLKCQIYNILITMQKSSSLSSLFAIFK